MPIYEYRCPNGHAWNLRLDVSERDLPVGEYCWECDGRMHRVFSFRKAAVIHEHFNHSVGQPISSMRQFEDVLKRQNEKQTERTGIVHNAVPVVPSDLEA